MKRILIYIIFTSLLISCTHQDVEQSNLIVEGWIEADRHPVVMLHKSYIADTAKHTSTIEQTLRQHIVNWGKVTISDGENEVIMIGRLDTLYMPPYYYTTADMKGEVGKTYTITAEYEGQIVSGTTTIPQPADFSEIHVNQTTDSTVRISAKIIDTTEIGQRKYALFSRRISEKQFLLNMLGVFTKTSTSDTIEVLVNAPTSSILSQSKSVNLDYNKGDTILLRLSTMDDTSYKFWSAFSSISVASGVFFYPVYTNFPSNMSNDRGYFCGYGSTTHILILDRDSVYHY